MKNFKNLFSFLIFITFLVPSFSSIAFNIIRDSEIEETIYQIAEPILKVSKVGQVQIYIFKDESFNAFTIPGNKIFISSGIINQLPNIDVLRGIIAHEVGHIAGGHIAKRDINVSNYNKIILSSMALGLLGLASGDPALAIAPIAMGSHITDRSIMAYSRTMESSADQAALRYLEQSGKTSEGLCVALQYLHHENGRLLLNPYDQTHPLSQNRLNIVNSFYHQSNHKTSSETFELKYKFARSYAKLLAFTSPHPKELLQGLIKNSDKRPLNKLTLDKSCADEISSYLKSILYFRTGDQKNSLKYVDSLLEIKPQDPYYHELKGQILFEFGKKEAINSYIIASSLKPNDLLLKLSKAIVGINIYKDSVLLMKPFFNDLKIISQKEPDNPTPYFYMAIYYEKAGLKAESLLNSAIIAFKNNNYQRATLLAKEAIKKLKVHSPDWYKANDIIQTNTK